MTLQTSYPLHIARHIVSNAHLYHDVPSVITDAWEALKAARGVTVNYDHIPDPTLTRDRPRGLCTLQALRVAQAPRISQRIAAHCAAQGIPYHGPSGGDAA